jgi:hypothetical protein
MSNVTSDRAKQLGDILNGQVKVRVIPRWRLPPGPALWLMLIVSACLWAGLAYGGWLIWQMLSTFI